MSKTPFTHEGLIERGFAQKESGVYEKTISGRLFCYTRIDDLDSPDAGLEFYDYDRTGFGTTITTLEDLDIFLSYIKHD